MRNATRRTKSCNTTASTTANATMQPASIPTRNRRARLCVCSTEFQGSGVEQRDEHRATGQPFLAWLLFLPSPGYRCRSSSETESV